MKIIILCAALLIMCAFVETQGQCMVKGKNLTEGTHTVDCIQYTCDPPYLTAKACAVYRCQEGKQIGHKEDDLTKPYPECCGGPICKQD